MHSSVGTAVFNNSSHVHTPHMLELVCVCVCLSVCVCVRRPPAVTPHGRHTTHCTLDSNFDVLRGTHMCFVHAGG